MSGLQCVLSGSLGSKHDFVIQLYYGDLSQSKVIQRQISFALP